MFISLFCLFWFYNCYSTRITWIIYFFRRFVWIFIRFIFFEWIIRFIIWFLLRFIFFERIIFLPTFCDIVGIIVLIIIIRYFRIILRIYIIRIIIRSIFVITVIKLTAYLPHLRQNFAFKKILNYNNIKRRYIKKNT